MLKDFTVETNLRQGDALFPIFIYCPGMSSRKSAKIIHRFNIEK
jgi:hypothetical protein